VEAAKPALSHYPTYPSVPGFPNPDLSSRQHNAYTPYAYAIVRLFVRHTDGSVNKKPSCR